MQQNDTSMRFRRVCFICVTKASSTILFLKFITCSATVRIYFGYCNVRTHGDMSSSKLSEVYVQLRS
ncbi:hypothetical protein BDV24DRAFT_124242 [Aspergillus arachidicola]|uniref:Uncharacterized protein n=1 Tax=Aspergillus arachidicola TaxID=656916 RepID=A0A5N6YKL0_9EURO|nr:hypothetical protein BDV24DRAFT_124242 [Aspergillus arachidicola]